MAIYTMLTGHSFEYDDSDPKVAGFVRELKKKLADRKVNESALRAFVFSEANPLVRMDPVLGATIDQKAFRNPVHRIAQDALVRKQVQVSGADVDEMAARYTMTVTEASKAKGCTTSAIRQAIERARLPSWFRGGQHYLDPEDVKNLKLERRGPKPRDALFVRIGHTAGMDFRIKHVGELQDWHRVELPDAEQKGKTANIVGGFLTGWQRVGLQAGGPVGEGKERVTKFRFLELAPGEKEETIQWGPFYIKGRVRVVRKINETVEARDAYKKFEPA